MSESLKSGLGTRTVMTCPESAAKLVGLNQVWKVCRLTLVLMRASMTSQMLAAMTLCPKKIRLLADRKLCRYVLFTPATSAGPIFRLLAGVVLSKVAAIRAFRGDRVCSRTIFHSVFHRCGKLGGTNRMRMGSHAGVNPRM